MKRSLALFVAVLIIPPLTAYATSVTSRSFVVRNTPAEPDPLDLFALLSTEPPAPAAPDSTTPAFTDEVETVEPESEEQDEPGEQPISPAFTDVVETEGQPATPIFTTPVSPGEGEQDEGEFVGEVERQDGAIE